MLTQSSWDQRADQILLFAALLSRCGFVLKWQMTNLMLSLLVLKLSTNRFAITSSQHLVPSFVMTLNKDMEQ